MEIIRKIITMITSKEIWKDIEDFEGYYQISNLGNVKSLQRLAKNKDGHRIVKERILRQTKAGAGYLTVMLSKKQIAQRKIIHRLIALYFIPNPQNKPCINHIDGNKLNNCINNLEWCTYLENNIHAYKNGLIPTKITQTEANQIRQLYLTGEYIQSEIGEMFDLTQGTVGKIVRNELWIN